MSEGSSEESYEELFELSYEESYEGSSDGYRVSCQTPEEFVETLVTFGHRFDAFSELSSLAEDEDDIFPACREIALPIFKHHLYDHIRAPIRTLDELISLLPSVRILEKWTGDARLGFDESLSLVKAAWSPRRPLGDGIALDEQEAAFWELDDHLVDAGVKLFRQLHFPDAGAIANDLKALKGEQRQHGLPAGAARSIQFLREVSQHRTAPWIASRVLESSPLPVEVVAMVATTAGGTARDLLGRWTKCRPQHPLYCPGTDDADSPIGDNHLYSDGCDEQTCPARMWTEWRPREYRWACMHGSWPLGKMVECPRAICKDHHDGDFNDGDWTDAPFGDLRIRER